MTHCSNFGIRTRVGVKLFPIWHGVRISTTARKFFVVFFYGKGGVEKWFPSLVGLEEKKAPIIDWIQWLLPAFKFPLANPRPSTCKMICVAIGFSKALFLHSNLHITTLRYTTPWPYFIVLIYLHYNYDVRIATFLSLVCHTVEAINVHKWWSPHVFQSSYVINTLEHEWEHCAHWRILGNILVQIQTFFYTYVSSICIWNRSFSWKNLIVQ